MKTFYFIVFAFNGFSFFLLYKLFPSIRNYLTEEDMLIENLTAVFFLCAALLSTYQLLKASAKPRKRSLLFIASLSTFAFLDELSFGERIFNFSMPMLGHTKIDAVHDFFEVGFHFTLPKLYQVPGFLLLSIAAAFIFVIAILFTRFKQEVFRFFHKAIHTQSYLFIFICLGLLAASMTIDLDMINNKPLFLLEELLEMNAGLACIFGTICIYRETKATGAKANQVRVGEGAVKTEFVQNKTKGTSILNRSSV